MQKMWFLFYWRCCWYEFLKGSFQYADGFVQVFSIKLFLIIILFLLSEWSLGWSDLKTRCFANSCWSFCHRRNHLNKAISGWSLSLLAWLISKWNSLRGSCIDLPVRCVLVCALIWSCRAKPDITLPQCFSIGIFILFMRRHHSFFIFLVPFFYIAFVTTVLFIPAFR